MDKIFISHASEDKRAIAKPLALALSEKGYDVWYDEFSLTIGDNLRKSIDLGLSSSDFGVIILSEEFFNKEWPQIELEGLVSKEIDFGKTILPVWHNIDKQTITKYSPSLSNKLAANTKDGIDQIVNQITKAINKKNDLLRIKRTSKKQPEFFKLLNLEIGGEKLIDSLMNNWINASGISKKDIERIEILLYEDYSGIDTYDNASIILSDSTKIKLRDQEINKTVNSLIPKSLDNYEVLYWVPNPKEYNQDEKIISIEECNLDMIAIKTNQKITVSSDAFDLIVEIIDFLKFEYEDYIAFSYDTAFEEGTYLDKLFQIILDDNRIDLIDKLIFKVSHMRRRASWAISQKFIRSLNDPLAETQKNLVLKLVKEQEPLNEYWREKLTSNFLEKKKVSNKK